jgi:hypothetical protein
LHGPTLISFLLSGSLSSGFYQSDSEVQMHLSMKSRGGEQKEARNSSLSPHFVPMAEIQDLLRSHDELRAALIIAGKRNSAAPVWA